MSDPVYITGLGIHSAIGRGIEETRQSLVSGRTGIHTIRHLNSRHSGELLAGEIDLTNEQLAQNLNIDSDRTYSRTALIGLDAARQAWQFDPSREYQSKTGFISSTSVGGIDKSELAYSTFLSQNDFTGTLDQLVSHDCGDSTERIADDLGIKGFVSTISTACSSSSNALILGARMIRCGLLDKVLVGGTDALTIYTLNGFNSLLILDREWCRPFDQNRKGLNLGEGAAFLTLESEASILRSGAEPICELRGYGNTNDAFHQTASSPEGAGAFRAMQCALDLANFQPADIDYINAHGTATPNNDLSEGLAIKNLFQNKIPLFSSTKSFTGHTLAAAGAIEAVISILCMNDNMIVPNLNFSDVMEELGIEPVSDLRFDTPMNVVLSNSFGFGGNCSALVFSRL